MTGFPEVVLGDVLLAPFVGYAAMALAIVVALQPVRRFIAFDRAFSHPPAATLCLYVLVLAALIVLF